MSVVLYNEIAAYLLGHDSIIHAMVKDDGVTAYKESPTGGDWKHITTYEEAKEFLCKTL